MELGERLGVDAEKLVEVLAQGSGASAALGIYGRLGSLAALGPGIDLLAKDLDLMADVASGVVATPDPVMAAGRRAVELARADTAPPTN